MEMVDVRKSESFFYRLNEFVKSEIALYENDHDILNNDKINEIFKDTLIKMENHKQELKKSILECHDFEQISQLNNTIKSLQDTVNKLSKIQAKFLWWSFLVSKQDRDFQLLSDELNKDVLEVEARLSEIKKEYSDCGKLNEITKFLLEENGKKLKIILKKTKRSK